MQDIGGQLCFKDASNFNISCDSCQKTKGLAMQKPSKVSHYIIGRQMLYKEHVCIGGYVLHYQMGKGKMFTNSDTIIMKL